VESFVHALESFAHARPQIAEWKSHLDAKRRAGQAKTDKRGQYVDVQVRQLAHYIASLSRPVDMDEAEQKVGASACHVLVHGSTVARVGGWLDPSGQGGL
jgi:hypothetical protein